MKPKVSILAALLVAIALTPAQAEVRFKVGTLAPEGTPWMDNLNDFLKGIEEVSPEPVRFVTYPGGVMGDEPDLVRKLKFGQLHLIAVTVSGLAQLVPEVLVLSLPFLFETHDEIDHVIEKMTPTFEQKALERGFVLVGLGDNGWINIYSKNKFASVDELRKQKVWMWNGNPLELKFMEAVGIKGHPVGVPEVLIGLQTGLLDTVMTSSTGVVALQWNTELKHQHQLQLRYEPGGVVAAAKAWNQIPQAKRAQWDKVVRDMVTKWFVPFKEKNRSDERMMTNMMSENGMSFVEWPKPELAKLREVSSKVAQTSVGDMYDQAIVDRVLSILADYRKSKSN